MAERYVVHADLKRLGQDGRPCGPGTTGLLTPRRVDGFLVEQIGKETNRLTEVEAGLETRAEDVYTHFRERDSDRWSDLVVPVLVEISVEDIARESGLSESAVREARAGRSYPHARTRKESSKVAVRYARLRLKLLGREVPQHPLACLYACVHHRAPRQCCGCGNALSDASRGALRLVR